MYRKLMPIPLAFLLALTIITGTALAGRTVARETTGHPPKITVLLLIDGLQQSHLHASRTPNITGLMNSGTVVENVTGIPAEIKDIVSVLLTGKESIDGHLPANFYSNQADHDIKTIFIDGSGRLNSIARGASVTRTGPFNEHNKIIEAAIKEIRTGGDIFCLVVLPRPSLENLSVTDNQVGLLLNHLRGQDMLNDSLIALTGTTGDPPIVLNGPKIKGGIKVPIASFADVAATVKFLNGQTLPNAGMVLYEAINPDDVRSRSYFLEQRIKELSEAYARATREVEQMRSEQKEVKRQQLQLDQERARFRSVIEKQQDEIDSLKVKITLFKFSGYLIILLFAIALYIEYRVLKKRFMFFT